MNTLPNAPRIIFSTLAGWNGTLPGDICELWEFVHLILLGESFPSLGSFPHMHALFWTQYSTVLPSWVLCPANSSFFDLFGLPPCHLISDRPSWSALVSPPFTVVWNSLDSRRAIVHFHFLTDHCPLLPDMQCLGTTVSYILSSFLVLPGITGG